MEQNCPNYTIKKIKVNNESDNITNNIIKVKNFISCLLYNYRKLKINDFNPKKILNLVEVLKELKIFMKSKIFVIDGSITSEWYVDSLLNYLNKIPKNLAKNNCEKLLEEMENEINNTIKELDFWNYEHLF